MVINKQPLYEQVYAELRSRIENGGLQPGARLDIRELAEAMGVSRTPVREAIRQLIQEGLVASDREGRSSVTLVGVEQLAEIYAVRVALEGIAVQIIADRASDETLAALRQAVEESEEAERAGDWAGVADANSRFHEELLTRTGNETLSRLLSTLRVQVRGYRASSMQSPERRNAARMAHMDLIELIENGQKAEASTRIMDEILEAGAHAVTSNRPDSGDDTPSMKFFRTHAELRGSASSN